MIVTKNLRKVFVTGLAARRTTEAVKCLDLSINKAEVFGLLGPNGAGKTTTVKLICGLIRATSGSIYLDGHKLSPHSKWPSQLVGAVLEGNRNVYWNLTPQENLLYFARIRGVHERDARSRTKALLEEFNLSFKYRDAVGTLSRGMQQKLALCCALISNPPILLVDEPTLGLDVSAARAIRAKLHLLAKEENRSILLTTHNMRLAASICDRVGIINKGEMVKMGEVGELASLLETSVYIVECNGSPGDDSRGKLLRIPGLTLHGREDSYEIKLLATSPDPTSKRLYQVIEILRGEHIQLISVREDKRSLEDIFVYLTEETPECDT
jgi:ABC-2 type transport system ATP-binding protein